MEFLPLCRGLNTQMALIDRLHRPLIHFPIAFVIAAALAEAAAKVTAVAPRGIVGRRYCASWADCL